MPRLPYRRPFRISSFTLACSSSRSARVGRSLAKGEPGLVSQSQEWYPKSQELHKTCLHSQIRDGKTKIRSRILKIRCGCEATPRWVRGHTQMGARAHRDGCEGTPRWVRGHTKMGARPHRDGCEATPRWVRGHTEIGGDGTGDWEGVSRSRLTSISKGGNLMLWACPKVCVSGLWLCFGLGLFF
jgi:hypothetical protein